jgi:hypothetical protein
LAGGCYISATVAEALTEGRAQGFWRDATVDAFDHPRVAVAHCYTDEVRLDAAETEPGAVGAAEVVRRDGRELGALAGFGEVATDRAPGAEKRLRIPLNLSTESDGT